MSQVLHGVRMEKTTLNLEPGRRGPRVARLGILTILLGLSWTLASLLFHVVPHAAERAAAPLFKGAGITPPAAVIFNRACANCHSEETRWPWYSQVAPASWLVEIDVKRARARMNLSRWDNMLPADQRILLMAIATVIENHEMPPPLYLLLHPEATLTANETVEAIEWTRAERRRLREAANGSAPE